MTSLLRLAIFALLTVFGTKTASAAISESPVFEIPVDCALGRDCFVQNYADQAAGPEARDHTCGPLAYDGHDGTDFRVPTRAAMERGVPVLAAAGGVVKATRDGMDDISPRVIGREAIAGREAGNGVVIDHGQGWESQYSHLRSGSVVVRRGDRVEAGQPIGEIGQSGLAEFPHVEFALRHDGQPVDPFTAGSPESGCGQAGRSLWSAAAQGTLAYRASGLLVAGFASEAPDLEAALNGAYDHDDDELPQNVPALVFWAASWGVQEGDREEIRLIGPSGEVIAESTKSLEKNKAQWMRFAGRKRRGSAWPAGRYRGIYILSRLQDGAMTTVIETSAEIDLR